MLRQRQINTAYVVLQLCIRVEPREAGLIYVAHTDLLELRCWQEDWLIMISIVIDFLVTPLVIRKWSLFDKKQLPRR